jgi:hypothetical protein
LDVDDQEAWPNAEARTSAKTGGAVGSLLLIADDAVPRLVHTESSFV